MWWLVVLLALSIVVVVRILVQRAKAQQDYLWMDELHNKGFGEFFLDADGKWNWRYKNVQISSQDPPIVGNSSSSR